MNINRYTWPVIIAAGLHGTLFLVLADASAHSPAPGKPAPMVLQPLPANPPPLQLDDPEDRSDSASRGRAEPLPGIPDEVRPLRRDDVFIVPVSPSPTSLDPVHVLPLNPHFGDGDGPGPAGFSPVQIPDVSKLDRVPRAMAQPAPAYPGAMKQNGINGSVIVEFVVDTTGRVISAEAVRWSEREFVEPAVRAVLRWRFEPGTQHGRKVRFRLAVPIEFSTAL